MSSHSRRTYSLVCPRGLAIRTTNDLGTNSGGVRYICAKVLVYLAINVPWRILETKYRTSSESEQCAV